jgi:uncharacterized protein (DUF885 family)
MALLLTVAFCPGAALATPADEARFKALYTREWTWRQAQSASDENSGGSAVHAHLPDVSAAAQAKKLAYWTQVDRELDAIPVAGLSPTAREDYQVYRAQIAALRKEQEFRDYEKPLSADTSFWSDLTYGAENGFKTEADYRAYLSQLSEMPRYFAQQVTNMRAGLARGFTLPQITLQGRDAPLAAIVAAKPADNVFYGPFLKMPATIPAAKRAALQAEGLRAITQSVIPAHQAVLKFMREDYIPGATKVLAAEALPDGKAYYQSKIREYATEDRTADEVHAIGLREVATIRARMLTVMRDAKFQGDLPAFLKYLRTDPQFYAKTPDELLKDAAWIAKSFDGIASDWFGHLPRSRFAIKPVPADIAPFYTSGRGGPGIYLVNTYDLPSRGLYSLPALTLHESAPGHAFQMPLANENDRQPAFRREVYISAYGEGWALYCEKLGEEMGMYKTPYDLFGMLSYQMWRAARLVVDTGIHAKGWTREQAQAYLRDNTALSDHEITTEVDRYIAWPGQALSYYLGELAIVETRAKAEKALGEKFDIRNFHDTVLEMGSAPLPVLRARIDRFIAEGGPSPYKPK